MLICSYRKALCKITKFESAISNFFENALESEGSNFPRSRFQREDPMPVYDYICNDCHKSFETVLTLNEHDHQEIKCPRCGSKNVEQEVAAFFAVTSKKS